MPTKSQKSSNKTVVRPQNTIEALKDLVSPDRAIDQLLGNYEDEWENEWNLPEKKEKTPPPQQTRQEFTIFNRREHADAVARSKEISELEEIFKQEMKALKNTADSVTTAAAEAEKTVLASGSQEKSEVYQARFMELLIEFIRSLRVKVSESGTWLTAMMSKKSKRGSLFAARSKKQGTAYSLSQELQSARSIQ